MGGDYKNLLFLCIKTLRLGTTVIKGKEYMKFLVILSALLFLVSCGHHGHKKSHPHKGHHMFGMMDANSDGKVSKAEFDKKHEGMFKKMDVNGDGSVTQEEMKSHHKMMMKGHKKSCGSCSSCTKSKKEKMSCSKGVHGHGPGQDNGKDKKKSE